VEAILYLDRTGCAWRYLPADFPPWKTVYGYFPLDDIDPGHGPRSAGPPQTSPLFKAAGLSAANDG
jgi:transposase